MSKNLEYYLSIHYKMVWEYDKDDEVYFVRFPELPGCLAHGKNEKEALKTALKVKDEWLEAAYASGWVIPEPSVAPETTGRVTLRLPKYLHQQVIDRAEEEGVSQNQLILSFIAQGFEKAGTEDSFKKIAAKQDEMVRLLKDRQVVEYIQPTLNTLFANVWGYPGCLPNLVVNPYLSASGPDFVTVSGVPTSVTAETIYAGNAATKEEVKEKLRLVKTTAIKASEEDYRGGYANEA